MLISSDLYIFLPLFSPKPPIIVWSTMVGGFNRFWDERDGFYGNIRLYTAAAFGAARVFCLFKTKNLFTITYNLKKSTPKRVKSE